MLFNMDEEKRSSATNTLYYQQRFTDIAQQQRAIINSLVPVYMCGQSDFLFSHMINTRILSNMDALFYLHSFHTISHDRLNLSAPSPRDLRFYQHCYPLYRVPSPVASDQFPPIWQRTNLDWSTGNPTPCFDQNEGGRFTDETKALGAASRASVTSMTVGSRHGPAANEESRVLITAPEEMCGTQTDQDIAPCSSLGIEGTKRVNNTLRNHSVGDAFSTTSHSDRAQCTLRQNCCRRKRDPQCGQVGTLLSPAKSKKERSSAFTKRARIANHIDPATRVSQRSESTGRINFCISKISADSSSSNSKGNSSEAHMFTSNTGSNKQCAFYSLPCENKVKRCKQVKDSLVETPSSSSCTRKLLHCVTFNGKDGVESSTRPLLLEPYRSSRTKTSQRQYREIEKTCAGAYPVRSPCRARSAFTKQQVKGLECHFAGNKYVTNQERSRLATSLKLTEAQVKTWYQNRRTKWRRQTAVGGDLLQDSSNREAVELALDTTTRGNSRFWSAHQSELAELLTTLDTAAAGQAERVHIQRKA